MDEELESVTGGDFVNPNAWSLASAYPIELGNGAVGCPDPACNDEDGKFGVIGLERHYYCHAEISCKLVSLSEVRKGVCQNNPHPCVACIVNMHGSRNIMSTVIRDVSDIS